MFGLSGVKLGLVAGAAVLALGLVGGAAWKVHAYMAEHDQAIADRDTYKGQVDQLKDANRGLGDALKQRDADLAFANGQVAAFRADAARRAKQLEDALKGLKNATGYHDPMSPVLGAGFDIVRRQWGQGTAVPAGAAAPPGR